MLRVFRYSQIGRKVARSLDAPQKAVNRQEGKAGPDLVMLDRFILKSFGNGLGMIFDDWVGNNTSTFRREVASGCIVCRLHQKEHWLSLAPLVDRTPRQVLEGHRLTP